MFKTDVQILKLFMNIRRPLCAQDIKNHLIEVTGCLFVCTEGFR